MVNQFYDAEIIKEYVMRGNSAIVKCSIPSFVADFVHVIAWVDEDGIEFVGSSNYDQGIRIHQLKIPAFPIQLPPVYLFGFERNPFWHSDQPSLRRSDYANWVCDERKCSDY